MVYQPRAPTPTGMKTMKEGGERARASAAHRTETTDVSAEFDTWLRSRGVWWDSALSTTATNVAAGYGVVATKPLQKGAILVSIPWKACFGASSRNADAELKNEDTQDALAKQLMLEQKRGPSSRWAALLKMLNPSPCPWSWAEEDAAYLDGTELAPVLQVKRQRLRAECEVDVARGRTTVGEYAEACALVAGHANPWYGGSIVPFNCTLNWSPAPNVEFESAERGKKVVGVATRDIAVGEELTQACASAGLDGRLKTRVRA